MGTITLPLPHMVHSLIEERNNMLILDTIINLFTFPPGNYQFHLAQTAQVMRYSRLANPYQCGQRVDIQLVRGQRRKNAHAAGVAKGAKKLCHMRSSVLVKNRRGFWFSHTSNN